MSENSYEKAIRDFVAIASGNDEAGKAIALAMLADAVKNGFALLASSMGKDQVNVEKHRARVEQNRQARHD